MNKLLKDIDADVASISQSRSVTGTSSSESTFRGLGTLSGKAIMGVGNVILLWIERMNIRARLRKINEQLNHGEGFLTPDVFEDVLELQR